MLARDFYVFRFLRIVDILEVSQAKVNLRMKFWCLQISQKNQPNF